MTIMASAANLTPTKTRKPNPRLSLSRRFPSRHRPSTSSMAENHHQTPDEAPPDLSKRKPDLGAAPSPDPKKLKPDDAPTSPPAAPNGSPAAVKKPVDKGKGILEEVEESSSSGSDDDDDDDDDEVVVEEDDDFVDDPLAEVDLSNILPSRTRRRVVMPGEFVVNDMDGEEEEDDEEEDVGVDGDNADDEDSD